jgi:flagellar biosynthetic protein FliO
MGAHLQDPSVPAARVEIPAELLREEIAAPSPRLNELIAGQDKKIGEGVAPEAGLGGALGATAFVLALLFGAFLLLRRLLGRSRLFASGNAMKILARRPLAPRQEVILVEIGARVLVIGATRESLSRLGELTSAEEIAALRARCGAVPAETIPSRPLRLHVEEPAAPPAAEARPGAAYDGVLEELSRIRTTVREWARQEA